MIRAATNNESIIAGNYLPIQQANMVADDAQSHIYKHIEVTHTKSRKISGTYASTKIMHISACMVANLTDTLKKIKAIIDMHACMGQHHIFCFNSKVYNESCSSTRSLCLYKISNSIAY